MVEKSDSNSPINGHQPVTSNDSQDKAQQLANKVKQLTPHFSSHTPPSLKGRITDPAGTTFAWPPSKRN